MRRLESRRSRFGSESTANPMDGLGNLSDVMLVLAVGIMLALIINWKLDISTAIVEEPETNEQIQIADEDISSEENLELDENLLERVGGLYYDAETDTYYAITGDE
ncbi:MAG: DUF2149 domain-containing protein [Oscillospiraceae bacterium]